jgi:hypothetical protein
MFGWRVAAAFATAPSHLQMNHAPSHFGVASNTAMPPITVRKLPAIIAFLEFVAHRAEMTEADSSAKFGRPWSCMTRQILPAFSEAVVEQARETAKALEHQPCLPLEAQRIKKAAAAAAVYLVAFPKPSEIVGGW